jgi:hypothetical protein
MSTTAPSSVSWYFPLRRPHTGVTLGNGLQGVSIWGENTLLLTVARASFWDHRGGHDILPTTHFKAVRHALETEDDAALAALFPKRAPGTPFPQQMGGGRLELTFAAGLRPLEATLDLATATVEVRVGRHDGDPEAKCVRIYQTVTDEVCWLDIDPALLTEDGIYLHPAFSLVHNNAMEALGIAAPNEWADTHGGGFVQTLPSDMPLGVAWQRSGNRITLATALCQDADDAVRARLSRFDVEAADAARAAFWSRYWADAARVTLPDAVLQQQFDYGLYRQAGLIRRHTPAATLQGPWMEDTVIPAWSNDYHNNINVQLVYGAALATGQAAEMAPLWDLLRDWLPRLREFGERFYETPGAMVLPHAVDDRCQMMGTFWAGTIDQACVAWMARVAYQYYQYTGDLDHLRELVWPLLVGAFEGYRAMLVTTTGPDGTKRFSLPISVSPEFGGSDPKKCWGRDASFQLAALHAAIHDLQAVAPLLGQPADPRWADVAAHLPPYTVLSAADIGYSWMGAPFERIGLWAGQDLSESHRHHAHLASIYPFCTVDPFDPAHHKIISRSLHQWSLMGMGNWTGWCVPWAAAICSRSGLPDSALSNLHLLAQQFTNEGHATLHNSTCSGMFAWDDGSLAWPDNRKGSDFLYYEIMQMDAAMAAISAILEMLVQDRDGTITITDRLPKHWRNLSFQRVRTAGGFEISGVFEHAKIVELTIHSVLGNNLRLAHSMSGAWEMDGVPQTGSVITISTQPGQTCTLRAISA